jgi:hypothetical protein
MQEQAPSTVDKATERAFQGQKQWHKTNHHLLKNVANTESNSDCAEDTVR